MVLLCLGDSCCFGRGLSSSSIELCRSGAKIDLERLLDAQESGEPALGGENGSNEVKVASDGLPVLASDVVERLPRGCGRTLCVEERRDDSWRLFVGCSESSMMLLGGRSERRKEVSCAMGHALIDAGTLQGSEFPHCLETTAHYAPRLTRAIIKPEPTPRRVRPPIAKPRRQPHTVSI